MARALELESQRWAQDVAPQSLDGHCHSELAIDILQVPLTVPLRCTGTATALMGLGGGPQSSGPMLQHPPMLYPCPDKKGVLCYAHPLLSADHFPRPDQG